MAQHIFEKEFKALGTDIYIQIVADTLEAERVAADLLAVEHIYQDKEKILSRFDARSELSKLNGALGEFHFVSSDILILAEKSLYYHAKSQGLFDPRILSDLERIGYKLDFKKNSFAREGGLSAVDLKKELRVDLIIENSRVKFMVKMDFSGIAKGYITDKVVEFLLGRGWENFLVDSGGDMYAHGKNKQGEKWGIALEGAPNENEIMVEIMGKGLATSGNTRRHWEVAGKKFHHLINPKDSNNFSFDLQSVTVVAPTTEEADVLAKVLFLQGASNGSKFAAEHNLQAIFLKANFEIIKINIG